MEKLVIIDNEIIIIHHILETLLSENKCFPKIHSFIKKALVMILKAKKECRIEIRRAYENTKELQSI